MVLVEEEETERQRQETRQIWEAWSRRGTEAGVIRDSKIMLKSYRKKVRIIFFFFIAY